MSLIGKILGDVLDVKGQVYATIQKYLAKVAEENNLKFNELFIMIVPHDENFNMRFFVYTKTNNEAPKLLKEITLDEILNNE